jgi:hypothetical protein
MGNADVILHYPGGLMKKKIITIVTLFLICIYLAACIKPGNENTVLPSESESEQVSEIEIVEELEIELEEDEGAGGL